MKCPHMFPHETGDKACCRTSEHTVHYATFSLHGTTVGVEWDYVRPAVYAMPLAIEDGIVALGDFLSAIGDAFDMHGTA